MNPIYGIVLSTIAALLAWFFKSKKDSAEALLKNLDVKEAVAKEDSKVVTNDALIKAEELKREELPNNSLDELANRINSDK